MDVLVQFMPGPVRLALQDRRTNPADRSGRLRAVAILFLCLADVEDRPHQRHGRDSDVDSAWHGGVGVCVDLADRGLAPCHRDNAATRTSIPRPRTARCGNDVRPFRRAGCPTVDRLSDLHGAAHGRHRRAGVLHARAARGDSPESVRIGQCDAAAGGAVLHLCRRADGAWQRGAAARRFRAGRRGLGARQPRRHHGRHLRDLRRDFGRERGDGCDHRQGHGAGDAARRLSGNLHRGADHLGRRHRRDHPAQHPDDRLWLGGGGIGGAALRRRCRAGPDDRGDDRALCRMAGAAGELRRRRTVRPQAFPARERAGACGRWARR